MRIPVGKLYDKYRDNIYAVAFNVCKNQQDAQDVVQDTFIRYHQSKKEYDDERHIRAWLIRTAVNRAKNINMAFWRRKKVPLEDYIENLTFETPESCNLFKTVMRLPQKYRVTIHLFYYEDYSLREIAEILKITESAAKTRLARGRKLLKTILLEEWEDDE